MEEKAGKWLDSRFDDYSIRKKVRGTANLNFFIEADREYVLRVSRDISKDRLENEFKVLQLLEEEKIENVPRVIELDSLDEKNVLLETSVGEKDLKELSEKELRNLARKAAEIHSISAEEAGNYLDGDGEQVKSLRKILREDFENWSRKPYREYLEKSDYRKEEMTRYYRRQKKIVENAPDIPCRQGLIHGDLGENIRIRGNQVFIVDWEFGRTGNPGMELLYLFERHELAEEEREVFLEEYSRHRELGECFEKIREIYPEMLAFNDAAWAAKRYAKTGEKKYRDMLDRRIERLQDVHGTNDS